MGGTLVTYQQLLTVLRRDLLAEVSQAYWSDADLLTYLQRASTEVAHELSFPVAIDPVEVALGATSFTLPATAAAVQLNAVSFRGMSLAQAPMAVVEEYRANTVLPNPRYYHHDPKVDPRAVRFGPPAPLSASFVVEYVAEYDGGEDGLESRPWGNLFPRYHELVAYRAAVKAFEASLENERAGYMMQRSQQLFASFAAFLGKTDLAELTLGQMAQPQGA